MKTKKAPPKKVGYQKGGPVRAKGSAGANKKKAAPAFGKRPKAKIPALGSGMMGLGATGSQGMMP